MRYPLQDLAADAEQQYESRHKRLAQIYVDSDSFNAFWLKASIENLVPKHKMFSTFFWYYLFNNIGQTTFNLFIYYIPFIFLETVNILLCFLNVYGDHPLLLGVMMGSFVGSMIMLEEAILRRAILVAKKYVKQEMYNREDEDTQQSFLNKLPTKSKHGNSLKLSKSVINSYKTTKMTSLSC